MITKILLLWNQVVHADHHPSGLASHPSVQSPLSQKGKAKRDKFIHSKKWWEAAMRYWHVHKVMQSCLIQHFGNPFKTCATFGWEQLKSCETESNRLGERGKFRLLLQCGQNRRREGKEKQTEIRKREKWAWARGRERKNDRTERCCEKRAVHPAGV